MARVDQQSVCDRGLFSELTESPIARQSECDRELFSELTESPFAQQSVCDRDSLQSSLNPRSSNKLSVIGSSFQSSLNPRLLSNLYAIGTLFRAHWTRDHPTNCQWSGALFRARWANCMRSGLSSEVFEIPIHLMLLNMVSPYVDVVNPTFDLQINGEGIWRWREVSGRPKTLFELFQNRCITTWIPDSRYLVVNAWGKHLRKAYGDFGSRSSPP